MSDRSDISRGMDWGCGVTLGVLIALFGLPLLCWLVCCGGFALLFTNTPSRQENPSLTIATQTPRSTASPPTTVPAPTTTREPSPSAPATKPAPQPPPEDPEVAKRRIEAEKAEYERREAARKADPDFGRNPTDERDAKTLLDLAKRTTNEVQRTKSLQSLIKQYPKTKAADEARKLLK